MVYLKRKIGSMAVIVPVVGSVYTVCPDCGKEHTVDLATLIKNPDFDLYSTAICCDECSARRLKRYRGGLRPLGSRKNRKVKGEIT